MTEALSLTTEERKARWDQLLPMRDRIIGQILEEVPDSRLTGHTTERLPNHASFVFKNVDGNELLMLLDNAGFECSSGSACKTGNPEPSGVLLALGLSPLWALGSLRITLGTQTSFQEVDTFVHELPALVQRVRKLH
jgi:cysteine desulfurase